MAIGSALRAIPAFRDARAFRVAPRSGSSVGWMRWEPVFEAGSDGASPPAPGVVAGLGLGVWEGGQ